MTERPLLMTPENAQKCYEGTKTQTRRVITSRVEEWDDVGLFIVENPCPYGIVGDRLWVREAFSETEAGTYVYRGWPMFGSDGNGGVDWPWTPAIHMPYRACRTVLEITDIRVERLKDISPADALAEGVFCPEVGYAQHGDRAPVLLYGFLWESINGKGSWELNPWVWVLSFRRVNA